MTKIEIRAELRSTMLKVREEQKAAAAKHNWDRRDEMSKIALQIQAIVDSI